MSKNTLYVPKNASKPSLDNLIQQYVTDAVSGEYVSITEDETITGQKVMGSKLTVTDATQSTSSLGGCLTLYGGLGVAKNTYLGGNLAFENSSYSASLTPTTLTANRTLTIPDVTDTIATLAATQTLTNKTISGASTFSSTSQPYYQANAGASLQTIGTGGQTTLTFWSGAPTSQGSGITFNGTSTFTVANAGMYLVSFTFFYSGANTTGYREVICFMGGIGRIISQNPVNASQWISGTFCQYLAANATVYLTAYQNSGVSINVGGNNGSSPFVLTRLF